MDTYLGGEKFYLEQECKGKGSESSLVQDRYIRRQVIWMMRQNCVSNICLPEIYIYLLLFMLVYRSISCDLVAYSYWLLSPVIKEWVVLFFRVKVVHFSHNKLSAFLIIWLSLWSFSAVAHSITRGHYMSLLWSSESIDWHIHELVRLTLPLKLNKLRLERLQTR